MHKPDDFFTLFIDELGTVNGGVADAAQPGTSNIPDHGPIATTAAEGEEQNRSPGWLQCGTRRSDEVPSCTPPFVMCPSAAKE